MSAPSNLEKLFGKKGEEEDDAPSDEDVASAKSTAFDVFFDAMHSKDREKARAAWDTLQGDDSAADEEPASTSDMEDN